MINWIMNYWSVIVWALPILIAFVVIHHYLGRRFAFPVGIAGIISIIFLLGKKIERDNNSKRVKDIEDKREIEYEKIDRRDTTASDVDKRLRDGSY